MPHNGVVNGFFDYDMLDSVSKQDVSDLSYDSDSEDEDGKWPDELLLENGVDTMREPPISGLDLLNSVAMAEDMEIAEECRDAPGLDVSDDEDDAAKAKVRAVPDLYSGGRVLRRQAVQVTQESAVT